jgi:hypothetical protein
MNRIQFFILTGLSSLVVLLLIGHILLTQQAALEQDLFSQARQTISQGEASQAMMKQLALRIFQDSQKTQDTELKDLLIRQQITYTPGTGGTNATESPAPPITPLTH